MPLSASQRSDCRAPADWGPSDYLENSDVRLSNWAIGCPPDSALRMVEQAVLDEIEENGEDSPPTEELVARYKKAYGETQQKPSTSPARSYIYDHSAAMDICQHPENMNLHGFTSVSGTDPGPLVPLFTFAKTNVHSDILVTPLEQYSDTYIGYEPDWDKKTKNMLMWRGSTTGIDFYVQNDWKNSQRARLHFLANDKEGTKSVLWAEGDGAIREKTYNVNGLNRAYMDVAFAGGPVQCDPETCALMNKLIDFRDTMGLNEAYQVRGASSVSSCARSRFTLSAQYKYVMDVDGNGWSGRFHRLMSMKACVFKSTLFPEWYADRVQPWLQCVSPPPLPSCLLTSASRSYVPVKVDYSDLYDIMTFFHGTPEGHGSHDELANKIGLAGKHWARDHWRKQDMAAYMCTFRAHKLFFCFARSRRLTADLRVTAQSASSSNGRASFTATTKTRTRSTSTSTSRRSLHSPAGSLPPLSQTLASLLGHYPPPPLITHLTLSSITLDTPHIPPSNSLDVLPAL